MLGLPAILEGVHEGLEPAGDREDRGRVHEGRGDLTQPLSNFSKFIVCFLYCFCNLILCKEIRRRESI